MLQENYKNIVIILIIHTTYICPFDQRTVINHCIIESESTGKVVCFITVSFQNTARNITAQTTLAYQIHRLSFLNFIDSHSGR